MLQITFGSKAFNMLLNGLGRFTQGFRNFPNRRSHSLSGKIPLNKFQYFMLLLRQIHTCAPVDWHSCAAVGRMPEAIHRVIIHHPHGLHEGITDRGSNKSESPFLQVTAHGF
jgi:hypothetical protein